MQRPDSLAEARLQNLLFNYKHSWFRTLKYADDTQLYQSVSPSDFSGLVTAIIGHIDVKIVLLGW